MRRATVSLKAMWSICFRTKSTTQKHKPSIWRTCNREPLPLQTSKACLHLGIKSTLPRTRTFWLVVLPLTRAGRRASSRREHLHRRTMTTCRCRWIRRRKAETGAATLNQFRAPIRIPREPEALTNSKIQYLINVRTQLKVTHAILRVNPRR